MSDAKYYTKQYGVYAEKVKWVSGRRAIKACRPLELLDGAFHEDLSVPARIEHESPSEQNCRDYQRTQSTLLG